MGLTIFTILILFLIKCSFAQSLMVDEMTLIKNNKVKRIKLTEKIEITCYDSCYLDSTEIHKYYKGKLHAFNSKYVILVTETVKKYKLYSEKAKMVDNEINYSKVIVLDSIPIVDICNITHYKKLYKAITWIGITCGTAFLGADLIAMDWKNNEIRMDNYDWIMGVAAMGIIVTPLIIATIGQKEYVLKEFCGTKEKKIWKIDNNAQKPNK